MGNYVYHHWKCTSIYQPLSYLFRSLNNNYAVRQNLKKNVYLPKSFQVPPTLTGALETPLLADAVPTGDTGKALEGCRVGSDMGPPPISPPPALKTLLLGARLLKRFGCGLGATPKKS